jgi:hypothetical protein
MSNHQQTYSYLFSFFPSPFTPICWWSAMEKRKNAGRCCHLMRFFPISILECQNNRGTDVCMRTSVWGQVMPLWQRQRKLRVPLWDVKNEKKKKNEKCAQSNITSNSLNNKGETDTQWEEGKGKRNTDALTRWIFISLDVQLYLTTPVIPTSCVCCLSVSFYRAACILSGCIRSTLAVSPSFTYFIFYVHSWFVTVP